MIKLHDKRYSVAVVRDIHQRALLAFETSRQWDPETNPELFIQYHHHAEALCELLENVVVFNVGDGMRNFTTRGPMLCLRDRIHSFDEYIKD